MARVAELSCRLRDSALRPAAKMSFGHAAGWHVTLKFLGDLEDARVPGFAALVSNLGSSRKALRTSLGLPTAFPSASQARVIVIPLVDTAGGLARLAAEVEERCATLGAPREDRPFVPHVTVARVRGRDIDGRTWLASEPLPPTTEMAFTSLVLYRSDPGPNGHAYTPLARVAVSGS